MENEDDDEERLVNPTGKGIEFSGSNENFDTPSTLKESKPIQQMDAVQSSIKRLQMVVKEKEDTITTLQNALFETHQAAVREQTYDQAQLEAFYTIFLTTVGGHDNPSSSANLCQALQDLSNQETKPLGVTSTLIKAIARLMDDYLKQLISLHEHDIQTLQKNEDFCKNQYRILETQCTEERLQHQLQINGLNEKFQNQILEDNLRHRHEINMYQDQFKCKSSKLKGLKEEMRLMELRLTNKQKNNTKKDDEHAKLHTKVSHLQSQVATLSNQLRQAKQSSVNAQLVDHVNCQAIKLLQEETTKGKEITHKLAVQLAQYRHKEKRIEPSSANKNIPLVSENKDILELNDFNKEYERAIQTTPHIHAFQDHGFNGKDVELETSKETLAKKVQSLQTKLKSCKNDLKRSEENRSLCEKMMQDYKLEVSECRKAVLKNKKDLLLEKRKPRSSTDCLKIKKLLENLQEVENDNNKLQKVVMVGQESTINKLKKEVTELKRFCMEMGKEGMDCDIHEYDTPAVGNGRTPDGDKEMLQLKFDRDQALWKLGQLERRMHILFEVDVGGTAAAATATAATEARCEYFIPPTTAPHAFAGKRLIIQEPDAVSLIRAFTQKLLPPGSLPREKELECVVEGLLRVVERKRREVECFQQACRDTIRHMERSTRLQQQVDELRGSVVGHGDGCGGQSSPTQFDTIADLKSDVGNLRQANTNLLRSLKDTEESFLEVQEKLREATKDKFSPQKRCSFTEAIQHDSSDLDVQAQEIARLQEETGKKTQTIGDLKSQLEARDDELDFLHGQLAIKEALESHKDGEITKEEMAKEGTNIENLSLENLQMANVELSKVCAQYEELLERQAEQLGIPFQSLRNIL